MDAIQLVGLFIFASVCFFFGFMMAAILAAATRADSLADDYRLESAIRKRVSSEIIGHAKIPLNVAIPSEKLSQLSPEEVGFNLGLHTAGLIIVSEVGDRLVIIEKVSEDGEIMYEVDTQ